MKYTIETIDTGCIEILTFQDGRKYYKRTEKTDQGYQRAGGACCLEDSEGLGGSSDGTFRH